MRWLVTGASGMLGQDLVSALSGRGHDVVATDRDALDITDGAAVSRFLEGAQVVVNCAAWTAVDAAEQDEAGAFAVNAVGAQNLARAARRHGSRLVQISTDYVFDGNAAEAHAEGAPWRRFRPTGARKPPESGRFGLRLPTT